MSTTTTFQSTDGTELVLRSWAPTGGPRAAVVVLHGLAEHSGRYEHVGAHLAAAGMAVSAVDFRGFGRSGGARAFVRSFDEYLDDTGEAVRRAGEFGVPVVLLGHSMGGLVALRYAQEREGADLLVLSAPSLDAVVPPLKRAAARMLRRVIPRLSLPNGITGDQLSTDPSVGEAYFADPLVYTKTTASLGGAFLEAMAQASSAGVPVPALVVHGGEDTLVPTRISAPLAAEPNVERVVLPGLRHEVLNEEGGTKALGVVTDWIGRRLSQTP